MHWLRAKHNQSKNDLSPWLPIKETDRTFDQTFTTFSLHHSAQTIKQPEASTPQSIDRGFPLRPILLKQSKDKSKSIPKKVPKRQEDVKIHGQALRVIKSYCKKFYTQTSPDQNPEKYVRKHSTVHSLVNSKKPKDLNSSDLSFRKKHQKTNVVDLTKSFSELCDQANQRKRPASAMGSKILKIKQEIKRHNQQKNQRRHSLNSTLDFCPNVQTLPLRKLISSPGKTIPAFPIQNFSDLLSHLLKT